MKIIGRLSNHELAEKAFQIRKEFVNKGFYDCTLTGGNRITRQDAIRWIKSTDSRVLWVGVSNEGFYRIIFGCDKDQYIKKLFKQADKMEIDAKNIREKALKLFDNL